LFHTVSEGRLKKIWAVCASCASVSNDVEGVLAKNIGLCIIVM
jgi:hypothetical protein